MSGHEQKPAHRLLVVEDDPGAGPVIVKYLERAGYEVSLAGDADQAIAAARAQDYDLVISDIVLGSLDGQDVVEAVLAIQPHIKVLLMSGYGRSPYGVDPDDPVLAKPFEPGQIVERVERLLAANRSLPPRSDS
jgi:two-component system cell cycle sensor histidine kinase/response regulator CckA